MNQQPDIVIIGSGIGGATVAAGLAPSGASLLICEAGLPITDLPINRDQRAIFQQGYFRPKELWYTAEGQGFNPGNYYNVGGNSKYYGAVLARFRREDFAELAHEEAISPAWPFPYEELEPWYSQAEQLYQVRGSLGEDASEPFHSTPYAHPALEDEEDIATVKAKLTEYGLHPYALPLGVDLERWLSHGQTPWDAHPHTDHGKMDAETCALAKALSYPNVRISTQTRVTRLMLDKQGRINQVLALKDGMEITLTPKLVVLAAGAVQSAALLLRSACDNFPNGLANSSDQVGRNFMNHNASALLAYSPFYRNRSVYQKTFGLNDFYLSDGASGYPLGNIQLLGRVSAPILKGVLPWAPEALLKLFTDHAIDFYAMSEDLPDPANRVRVDGERIILDWRRTNWQAHLNLVAKFKEVLQAIGFPIVLTRAFDKRTPSHQCGTIRMGRDEALAPLDPYCRAYDHANLFVVDASFLPSSAAMNPALTIAAQALRVADHIINQDLRR